MTREEEIVYFSSDVEEAADIWYPSAFKKTYRWDETEDGDTKHHFAEYHEAFKAGAEWYKNKSLMLPKSLDNAARQCATFSAIDFKAGAEWMAKQEISLADKTMLIKATEWLSTNLHRYDESIGLSAEEFVERFKKAMEELL